MPIDKYPQSTVRAVYLDDRTANLGGIYENAIAQELNSKGYELFYYEKSSRPEVDFIVDGRSGSLPIEVKSGRNYTTHAALDGLLAIVDYHAQDGLVLCRSNVFRRDNVLYLPFCMLSFLDSHNVGQDDGFQLEIVVL